SGGGTAATKVVSIAGVYTVTVTSSNGCTSTSQTTVTEDITRPTVSTSNDGPLTCAKTSVTLTATGGGSYAWSGGGTAATKVVSIAGVYTVTVTSSNGCLSTSQTTVTEDNIRPTITTSIDGPLTCAKTSVTLTATGGGSYAWSGGGNVATKVVSDAGLYTVTVTSANGCSATSTVTIQMDTIRPVVNILNGGILTCGNTSITLTASGGGTYLWSTGETTSVKIASVAGNYTVTVTGTNGCSSSGNTSVEQNITPPVASASNDGPVTCLKTSVTLTATGGGLYNWSGGGTGATKIVTVAGTYTVTVTAPNRCTSTATTIVLQNTTPPVVSISGVKKICEGASTTLTASGGISYTWSNGQTTAAISVSPVINTLYTVTVTNAVGCTAVAVDSVMIKNKPDVVFSGVNTICVGDSAVIVVTGNTDNECPGVCNVTQPTVLALWNLNACHAIMSSGTHLDYSEFTPIVSTSNCNNVTAGNVHRLPGNKHSCTPSPNGSIGMCIGTQMTCNPSKVDFTQALRFEVRLTPTQAGQITGLEFLEQSPENYIWVDGPTGRNNFAQKYILRVSKNGKFIYYKDNISTSRNWTLQNFDFSDNDNFRTLIPATYLFELIPYCTINNGAAESIWDIDEIKVLGGCCNGTTTEIAGYRWSDNSTSTSITVKPTVNSTYTVTVTDCCGCTNTKQVNINVTNLIADLGDDRMISMGQTVTLTPIITGRSICDPNNQEKNVVKYLWSTGATTSSITVTPGSSTFYRVTVTDCNECTDTESISIHVMMPRPLVVYPNPAYNKVNLASESEIDPDIKVRIISSDGKTVISDKPEIIFNTASNISILIPENVRDGLYYMEIRNGQNKYVEKLILIER
ncbi:MAG: T9SS type A sorting domain-containing protein, partial [Saprospiraceae bacterium]|nr:T9SS type A sorting domain-containing protein [Saprospiraceae bacterium]